MKANRQRYELVAALVLTAVVTAIGTQSGNTFVGWLGLVLLLASFTLFVRWRRTALAERRARVFDREAKTDEAGTRPDR
jgi:LPXTG-motif cell wall-anchored protein